MKLPQDAPLAPGLPLLGSAIAASGDTARYFARCHQELGPVFRVAYPGRTMVMLAGLEANRFFALEGERVFGIGETYARVTRELGRDTYPNAHDGERHRQLRKVLAPSLSAMAVEPFLPQLFELVAARAAGWTEGDRHRAGATVAPLVTDVVALCTTGREAGERLSRSIDLWSTMMGVVAVGHVLPEFTLYLPPVRAARAKLTRFLEEGLADHRRRSPAAAGRAPDVLDALLAQAGPGEFDDGALLVLAMIPLKNAGIYLYRLVSFVLFELLSRPALLEAATAEVDAAWAQGPPGIDALRRLRTLQGVVLECLRLHPMALALPRRVGTEFELAGYRFVPGQTLYIAGPCTHFDSTLFPDPAAFDPERFSLQRCEHRRPHAFAPFGLGPHACAARGYSQLLATIVVAGLLRAAHLRLDPPGQELKVRAFPNPIPEAKFGFKVQARQGAAAPARTGPRESIATALWELTPERRDQVFAGLEQRTLAAGEVVFRQGDPPDHVYVIRRGEVEVLLEEPGREPRVLARLGVGDHFGEIGVLQGVPRNATVRTVTEVGLLTLGREAVSDLAVEADVSMREVVDLMERRAMATGLARALPMLDTDAASRLSRVCQRRTFEPGEAIVRQGEPAEAFYVLVRGRVELSLQPPQGPEFVIGHLDAVDFFGELGLLQGGRRTATARAVGGPVTVLEMSRERFQEMIAASGEAREDLGRIAGERLLALALVELGRET